MVEHSASYTHRETSFGHVLYYKLWLSINLVTSLDIRSILFNLNLWHNTYSRDQLTKYVTVVLATSVGHRTSVGVVPVSNPDCASGRQNGRLISSSDRSSGVPPCVVMMRLANKLCIKSDAAVGRLQIVAGLLSLSLHRIRY